MKYILRKVALYEAPEIEISKENYTAYKVSREILSNCLAIEEKYEILISNFVALENEILEATTMNMVRTYSGYQYFFDVQLALDLRLVNLLTSARLYVDQLYRHVKKCLPDNANAKILVKSILLKEYDANPEYRFMEALRNHVQHFGLAVHSTSRGFGWTNPGEDGLLEYYMEFSATKSLLEENKAFKKAVLNECSDEVDLKVTTRSYIESLSKVHEAVRELIQKSVQNSRLKLEDAHREYSRLFEGSLFDLSACIIDGQEIIEKVPLMLDWDDIRVKLQKRNKKLINLKKRHVTGKVKKSK